MDKEQIALFVRALFCNAVPGTWVSLRAFPQVPFSTAKPVIRSVKVDDLDALIEQAYAVAVFAANYPSVFCPPVCTLTNDRNATLKDLANGLVLTVDIDKGDTTSKLARIESVLGTPTLVMESGGEIADPETGEVFAKVHVHLRLDQAAVAEEDHKKLKRAMDLLADLIEADRTGTASVHPFRWPGTWNVKDPAAPRMAKIVAYNPGNSINLDDALARLQRALAKPAPKPGKQKKSKLALEEATAMLSVIPNKGYERWRNIGFALSHEYGEDGWPLWRDWSLKSDYQEDEDKLRKKWDSLNNEKETENPITIATLIRLAIDNGYVEPEAGDDDPRPKIKVSGSDLNRLADEAEAAILTSGLEIYQRGGWLVRPAVTKLPAADGGTTYIPTLHTLGVPDLLDMFCQCAVWLTPGRKRGSWALTNPSGSVAAILLSRVGRWHLPTVRGILTCPSLRPDGSLLDQPGYDQATGWYLQPPPDLVVPPIPEKLSKKDVLPDLARLEALLVDFPFTGTGSKAVGLATLMTPVIRAAIPVAPLHAMSAPTPGTGKSYLLDIAAAIAMGDRCPVIVAGRSAEEFEKRLNGMLLLATPFFSIDNVEQELEGELLCQATERPLVYLRRLGKSDIYPTLNGSTVGATGNNLVVRGDMVRRVIRSQMDAKVERPETRAFNGNPFDKVMADRGAYVGSVLRIVRAYLQAEPVQVTPLGSYEAWSRFVREPLVWLGREDPVSSMEALRAEDPVLISLCMVTEAWEAAIGLDQPVTAAEIVKRAKSTVLVTDARDPAGRERVRQERVAVDALKSALETVCTRRGDLDSLALGYWLRTHNGRPIDGKRIVREGVSHRAILWKLTAS